MEIRYNYFCSLHRIATLFISILRASQQETGGNSDVIWQKTRCMVVRCNRSVRAWFDNDDDEKHVSGRQQVISIVCIARRSTCGQSRISFMRHVPMFRKPKTRLVGNFHNALRCNVRCRDCRWNRSNDHSNNPRLHHIRT